MLACSDHSSPRPSTGSEFRSTLPNISHYALESSRCSLQKRRSTLQARLQGLGKLKEQAQAAVLSQSAEDSRLLKKLRWEIFRLDHDIAGTNASLEHCAQNLLTLEASMMYYSRESRGAKLQTAGGGLDDRVRVDSVDMPASKLNGDSNQKEGAKLQAARGSLGARICVNSVDMTASNSNGNPTRKGMRDGGRARVSQSRTEQNPVAGKSIQNTVLLRFRRHSISDLSSSTPRYYIGDGGMSCLMCDHARPETKQDEQCNTGAPRLL
jgi:hypothetical protein